MTAAEITDPSRLREPAHPAPYPLSLDIRVTAARELMAEQHQPAGMPAGDARALLARSEARWLGRSAHGRRARPDLIWHPPARQQTTGLAACLRRPSLCACG